MDDASLDDDDAGKSVRQIAGGEHDSRLAIAKHMEMLAFELKALSVKPIENVPAENIYRTLAAKLYSARRKIDEIFEEPGLAVSPAWDMLLDLYEARAQNKDVSVTSACIGAACPTTTGLRWLQLLEKKKLIKRKFDPNDKRRNVVELTDRGRTKVEIALAAHI